MSRIIVVGAGGHGRVVAEAAVASGDWSDVVFLDDRYPELSAADGYPVVGHSNNLVKLCGSAGAVVVAVGDSVRRLEIACRAESLGYSCPPVVHPAACISQSAYVGSATVVLAGAVVGVGTHLGRGCIANTGCTIDHDCYLGDGVHVSPGANIAGGVTVGDFSWVGIGATINQSLTIGRNVVVGASAAVIENVPDGITCVGVPARIVNN